MGKRKRRATDRLWVVCNHVLGGAAAEVWCDPERIALCKDCEGKDPRTWRLRDMKPACPVCLADVLRKRIIPIHGREHLERDRIVGHVHHN